MRKEIKEIVDIMQKRMYSLEEMAQAIYDAGYRKVASYVDDTIQNANDSDISDQIDEFCTKFGVSFDNFSWAVFEMDFEKLTKAYEDSLWLRTNITSISRICREYKKIVGGYYKDYKEVNPNVHFENERKVEDEESLYTKPEDLHF